MMERSERLYFSTHLISTKTAAAESANFILRLVFPSEASLVTGPVLWPLDIGHTSNEGP